MINHHALLCASSIWHKMPMQVLCEVYVKALTACAKLPGPWSSKFGITAFRQTQALET